MSRRYRVVRATRVIGTLFIIIAAPIFLLGVIALISPTGFSVIVSHFPPSLQEVILADMLFDWFSGSTSRAWSYILGGGLLGGVGLFLRSR